MKITDQLLAAGWLRTYGPAGYCGMVGIGRSPVGYCEAHARWMRYLGDRPVCARHALQAIKNTRLPSR